MKPILLSFFLFPLLLLAQPSIPQAVIEATSCRVNLEMDSLQADVFKSGQKGTAFLVKDKTTNTVYLLTAAHVVAARGKIQQLFVGNNKVTIETKDWIWDSQKDFAICEVKQQDFPANLRPIPFNELADLQLNETTYIPTETGISVGELLDTNSTSVGNIAAYHLLKCSNKVKSGQSGSPIFNAQGKVIGIVLRKEDYSGYCFALDRRRFVELIYQLQGQGKANRIYLGVVFAADTKGEHPYIADYIPNSPAAKADIDRKYIGLKIVSLDDKPVTNLTDIHKILEEVKIGTFQFFITFPNNRMTAIERIYASNREQEQIVDYFCQKYLQPLPSPPISFVQVGNSGGYEVVEKWQLGGIIRTFSWNNDLIFYDKSNTVCPPINFLGLEKVLIF